MPFGMRWHLLVACFLSCKESTSCVSVGRCSGVHSVCRHCHLLLAYLTVFDESASKLLDPFGIVGSYSDNLRGRMVEKQALLVDSNARGTHLSSSESTTDTGVRECRDDSDNNNGDAGKMV